MERRANEISASFSSAQRKKGPASICTSCANERQKESATHLAESPACSSATKTRADPSAPFLRRQVRDVLIANSATVEAVHAQFHGCFSISEVQSTLELLQLQGRAYLNDDGKWASMN